MNALLIVFSVSWKVFQAVFKASLLSLAVAISQAA
jgi:hypothetical protein